MHTLSEFTADISGFHSAFLKALYQDIRAMWCHVLISAGKYCWNPQLSNWLSLTHLMMAEMKAKYRKEKQTDTSAPLSILTMLISLTLSPIVGVVLDRHRLVEWSRRHKKHTMRSMYTDIPIFLAQKNTLNVTVSIFIRYTLIQCL